jgi:hypothetical protein
MDVRGDAGHDLDVSTTGCVVPESSVRIMPGVAATRTARTLPRDGGVVLIQHLCQIDAFRPK